jgi:signal transduction histidine kinase
MNFADPGNRLQRLERLIEVCRSLGKSEDVEHLLQTIVTAACDLTSSQYCFILVYEQETDLLKIVAGPNTHRETLTRIRVPLEKSLAGYSYSKSRPVSIQNAQSDGRIFRDIERALGYVTRSILAVPLIFRGETIGVLEAVNKQSNVHYTEEDLTILDTLASQAAVATLSTLLFEETKQAYDEVQELERMKSDFIAVASHELRTPLGLVLGHATFLHELIKEEQQRHQLDIIIRNATRLKTIIEDLSNVNSLHSGVARLHQNKVSVNQLVTKLIAANLEASQQKKISLKSKLSIEEININGDEEKLGIALNNLISNAISFTDNNGHVLVTVEPLPGYVQITVIDDGIGIPAKDLPHIFDRFFQVQSHLTRRHGGMGLGLSVSKAMVEMHQGQIWAESIEGKGSKFYILLPTSSSPGSLKESVFQS